MTTTPTAAMTCSKWIVRIVVVLLLWPSQGWDTRLGTDDADRAILTDREASIARTGVRFEHASQLFLWILVLAVHEMADSNRLRRVAIVTTILWLLYVGVYGASAFFVGCQSYGLCLVEYHHHQVKSALLAVALLVALAMSSGWCGCGASSGTSTAAGGGGGDYEAIVNGAVSTSASSLKSADEEQTAMTTTACSTESATTSLLNEALRLAKSECKDKDKLIAKLGKKLRSLLAENEELRNSK